MDDARDAFFQPTHRVDEQILPDLAAALLPTEGEEEPKAPGEPALARALLADAVRLGCSDIHLGPCSDGVALRLRVDGALREAARLPGEIGRHLVGQLRTMSGLDPTSNFLPDEARRSFRVGDRTLDLRLVAAPCLGGEKLSIRLLDGRRVFGDLPALGMNDDHVERIGAWLTRRTGMLLAVGPTNHGKTSTIYALLQQLGPDTQAVISIEDPVEYRIDGVCQMQVDEEHGLTFSEGLKTMLRLDPDALYLGEIRDAESARIAVAASVTGHVLLSSLHGADAVGAVTSLRNKTVADQDIADALEVVVSQRLVRLLCPECRRSEAPDDREASWLRALGREAPRESWRSPGCAECDGSGRRGRTGLFEVWKVDPRLRDRIAAGDDEQTLRRELHETGHATLLDHGLSKVADGLVGLDELRRIPDLWIPTD